MLKTDFLEDRKVRLYVRLGVLLILYIGYNFGVSRELYTVRNYFALAYVLLCFYYLGRNYMEFNAEFKGIYWILLTIVGFWVIRTAHIAVTGMERLVCTNCVFSLINLMLSAMMVLYIYLKYAKRLNPTQFLLDSILIQSVLVSIGFSMHFFAAWSNEAPLFQNLLGYFYHFTEILIIVFTLVIFTSYRKRSLSSHLVLLLMGTCFGVYLRGLYQYGLNTDHPIFMDFVEYFYLFSTGYYVFVSELISNEKRIFFFEEEENEHKITESNSKTYLLLGLLILAIVLYTRDYITTTVLLFVLVVLFIYYLANHSYKKAQRMEIRLQDEEIKRMQLEEEVERRTYELKQSYLELQEKNELLAELIYFDMHLGLYTIRYMQEYLTVWNEDNDLVLFVIDIKEFKAVNSQFNYAVGDEVLKSISRCLKEEYSSSAVLFRLNSNRFGLLFLDSLSKERINRIATEIHDMTRKPFIVDEFKIRINFSIGVACYEKNSSDIHRIIENAEYAERVARSMIMENTYQIFDREIERKIEREKQIRRLLEDIDFDEEFELFYQPQCEVNGELIGMEALLRWHSPVLGNVSPAEFIPIAEGSSVILRIAQWTLRKGIEQIKNWNTKYHTNYRVGINISTKFIENFRFLKYVQDRLTEYSIPSEWLDLEITETSLMNMNGDIISLFEKLTELGVSISIDDFGTGYSSLGYINNFQISTIKIAKELVDGIVSNKKESELVKAIIQMANSLKLGVIAEGVEEKAQIEHLASLGCQKIQGYYYGKPTDAATFENTYIPQMKLRKLG